MLAESYFVVVFLSPCRYVFCQHDGYMPIRSMPSSMHKMYLMADTIFQRMGKAFKGTRSWRRLVCNGVLSKVLASGDVSSLQGVLAILSRLGGWSNPDLVNSTCWEIYTATVTDMQAIDLTRVCAGRSEASDHRVQVRLASLASLMSATSVAGWDGAESGG